MTRNPYAIAKGDRVVFSDDYPVFANGVVVGHRTVEVRGVVDAVIFDGVWPKGTVWVDVDQTSLPPECRLPTDRPWTYVPGTPVPLDEIRHDRSRAS